MKKYLSGSLLILFTATFTGFLIHTSNRSSVAHASSQAYVPISPLVQLADSLRGLSLSLDARIREMHAIDSTICLHLHIPVMSTELCEVPGAIPAPPEKFFGPLLPDAFLLSDRIGMQRRHMDSLAAHIDSHRELIAHLPTLTPAAGTLSSPFGSRFHPIDSVWKDHEGLDIAAASGSIIHAAGDGVVAFSGTVNGYGNLIEIDHGHGYHTRYAHCRTLMGHVGDTVRRGDAIALVGTTGHSTGPHLHFEMVVDDVKIDPMRLMRDPLLPRTTVAASELAPAPTEKTRTGKSHRATKRRSAKHQTIIAGR